MGIGMRKSSCWPLPGCNAPRCPPMMLTGVVCWWQAAACEVAINEEVREAGLEEEGAGDEGMGG